MTRLQILISSLIVFSCVLLTTVILASWKKSVRFAEVPVNLRRIYEGAAIHSNRAILKNVDGKIEMPWFPPSTELTPSIRCCKNSKPSFCNPGGTDFLSYDPFQWETGSWKDLRFSIEKPHLFRYRFENTSTDLRKSFKAMAVWEPECDGRRSIFFRSAVLIDGKLDTALEIHRSDN
ncbi:MAG: hypothetical protein JXR95_10870 [Deltaproteobacteria bacterium]|nr:hypothetical protein [Deltaproteobacteria bacterium]